MEGCPRSLMLNVDLKETFPTEFTPSLKTYIREHYNEDADSYKNECSQLEQLRTASQRPSHDHSGCSTLRRYYAQLQFLQSRFPLGEGGAVNVQFTWTDLYSEEPISLYDIKFEQGAILHNLAALHSQLGCQEDRTAEEGMKVACTHFQAAAGIFQHLKVGSFCKVEHFIDNFASDAFFDMASGLLQLYTNVMLGQAQECLLEKSILDSRKDSLIARISMQVHDYYKQALQFLDTQGPSFMGSRKAKIWTKNLKIKCCQYLAVAYIHMSNNADENQKFGEKVTYLKAASQKITEAQKASKGQPEKTLELLQFLVDVVSNKLQGAVKDNDFIYHEVVPELDTLPEIKAAPLVKPIPFQPCDPSVAGPDIFQRLIPMEAHTDSSLYSEEKAKLLRRYASSIEQKNQLLSKALGDLHIDDLLEPEGYDTLPAVVKQKSDSLKRDDNSLKGVENNIEELTKVGSKVADILTSLAKMLEEDKQKEKELTELVGPMAPPAERKDFERDLEQCQESHKKATQTNTELLKVFQEHKHNLDLLTGPSEGLIAALPSLNIIDTPIDDGAVQRLRDLISKVDLMKSQRKQLEAELRQQLADDDITQLLVTREDGNKMVFFEEQLKKHDGTCALIQANLDAQPKILKALTEANAKYAPTRQAVKETAQRRDDAVQSFVLSHDTFLELKEKLSRGLRFYQGLEQTVLKLEEKIKEFYQTRKKEIAKIEEKEKKAKDKTKPPPARPDTAKPDRLVHPPASSVSGPPPSQYPGGLIIRNPGVRPGTPNPAPQGVPLHPRIPGGAISPLTAVGRFYPSATGGPMMPPVLSGDPRVLAPEHVPGGLPRTRSDSGPQYNYPDQRISQPPASQAAGHSVHPSMQPRHAVPFSQVGPRSSVPTEHLIHSTPRMSYPVPVGPSIPPGSQPGFQPGLPAGSLQIARPPQPRFAAGQVSGPNAVQGLPSYDQAKLISGSSQLSRTQQPPTQAQQNWPHGQNPATSQQAFNPQQQYQPPRGPHLASQPQYPSQAGLPQRFQQPTPLNSVSQTPQSVPSQQPARHWQSQPFQFPKLAQQRMHPPQNLQPQQAFQPQQPLKPEQPVRPQQPLQPQQSPRPQQPLQPQQPLLPQQLLQPRCPQEPLHLQEPLHPQQPLQLQKALHPQQSLVLQQPMQPRQPLQPQQLLQPQQQFQQPHVLYQGQQHPPPAHSQQQYRLPASSQTLLEQPLQPQNVPPAGPQMQHPLQPQSQSHLPRTSQQTSQFQQQQQQQQQQQPQDQQLSQPPQQFKQSMQQLQELPQHQQQFPKQQQNKESLQQPHQFQPTLQGQGQSPQLPPQQQQFQSPLQPQHNFQQPIQPLQPQKPQTQSQYLQRFQPNQSRQPVQEQQFSKDTLPQQSPYPGQQTSQNLQTSQALVKPSPSQSQISQMSGASWQQQLSDHPSKVTREGYAPQQPHTGYSPGQQPLHPSSQSVQLDYPFQVDKQHSQITQSQESRPSQPSHLQSPGGLPPEQNTFPASSGSWPYVQASQPLPSPRAPLSSQALPRQGALEQQHVFGGKQIQGPQQVQPYKQTRVDQVWSTARTNQSPPHEKSSQKQTIYPAGISRQNSTDYSNKSQYPEQSRGQISSYPSYSGGASDPLPSPSANQPYMFSQGSAPSAPPLVQGVRPSPTSVPSSAYATSYSVSVANAQLNQQQQMQQLQTQMLLQQQQLILQQQELLRHQQQQQQHDSDQGNLAQLVQQMLQQQTKLAEMEQKLKDKEEHDRPEQHDEKAQPKEDQMDPRPFKVDKEVAEKDLTSAVPQSSSSFSTSWGSGFSDNSHGKLDIEQVFGDLAKKQLNEISEKGKHTDGIVQGSKLPGHSDLDMPKQSEKELVGDESITAEGESGERKEVESGSHDVEDNVESESSTNTEQKLEPKIAVELSSSSESKPELKLHEKEHSAEEAKEKRRLQEIEEQIQRIKELQKNTAPPLPPKTKYLYEPGKMPQIDQLPIKPPDTTAAVDPNKPSLHRQCGHYYETQKSRIGQDENNECLSEEEYIQRLSRTVETFDALVVSLEQKRENAPYNGFIHEWKALEKMQESDSAVFSTQAATLNPSKNRYRDILPWDHTRVTLNTKEGGDYINANVIKNVTPLSPDYILTQGPIAATLGDFWLMVWERKSPVIVMLTKEVEGNRLKCHQYWPIDEGHTVVYGAIRVHMRSLTHCQAWIERIMQVQHAESDEVLVVTHLQFIGWPDHGVPHSPSDLLTFLSEVHNHHKEKDPNAERPLVVHCSAGVGRAGTFCVIYSAIRELNGTGNIVDVPKLVRTFRKHRKFTVQKKEQYEFCYRAILFYANQFIQLEKTAIAFKKSKVASGAKINDTNPSPSTTSLNDSRQRKPDEVSFLGEISDEESCDSDSEFEKVEEDDVIERKNLQSSGPSVRNVEIGESENNKTDKESSEVKESSDVIENSSSTDKDTMDTLEESSVIEKSEGKNELQDPSQSTSDSDGADKNTLVACDASSGNTDRLAVIDDSDEKNEVQDSSQLGSDSVDPEKGNSGVDESPASDADLSAMAEKSGEKMSVEDDSSAKREDCSSDEKSCVEGNAREFEECRSGGEGTVADGCKDKEVDVEETKTECSSELKEIDGTVEETKRENVNERNEKEQTTVQEPVCKNDKQNAESDLSAETNSSVEQSEEELPKEQGSGKDQTIPPYEEEKQKENEGQLHRDSRQQDENSKEERREETRELQNSKNTDLNNEQDSENETASVTKGSEDERQANENEFEGQAATGTVNQVESTQDSENFPTNET